jgi:hypothetical protein
VVARSAAVTIGEKESGSGEGITDLVFSLGADLGLSEPHPWKETCIPKPVAGKEDITASCGGPFVPDNYKYRNQAFPSGVGHRNKNGLTGRGTDYVNGAMAVGMIVDIAHMSDKSATAAIKLATAKKYPVMISHAGFRAQMARRDYSMYTGSLDADSQNEIDNLSNACLGVWGAHQGQGVVNDCTQKVQQWFKDHKLLENGRLVPGTINRGYLPAENDIPDSQIDAVGGLGGVVGSFAAQEPIDDEAWKPPFENDCAMSSKGFATSYGYGLFKKLKTIAFATDLGMHATTNPRFGKISVACGADRKVGAPDQVELMAIERAINPGQYRVDDQKDGVVYTETREGVKAIVKHYGNNAPLRPMKMGNHVYDFNVDGLAQFGLLPDMIQDIANYTHGKLDLNPLFESAESYIEMWEKAWTAVGCTEGTCNPARWALNCDKACRGMCPASWNGGAPLTPLASLTERCGGQFTFEGSLMYGSVTGNTLGDGDWGIYQVNTPLDLHWRCDGSLGHTRDKGTEHGCPADTRFVKVFRGASSGASGGKAVHIDCLAPPQENWEDHTPSHEADAAVEGVYVGMDTGGCNDDEGVKLVGEPFKAGGNPVQSGQRATYKLNHAQFQWTCGTNKPNSAKCPLRANLVRITRDADRGVTFDCFAPPDTSVKDANAAVSGQYKGDDHGGCNDDETVSNIEGVFKAGANPVLPGQRATYSLNHNDFHWTCGKNSPNESHCPPGSNMMRITRDAGRRITFDCFGPANSPAPPPDPSIAAANAAVSGTYMGMDHGGCNSDEAVHDIGGVFKAGANPIGPGQRATYRLNHTDIVWTCGKNKPNSPVHCPAKSNLVRITRDKGRGVTFDCFHQ